jgi:hypothetical protein
MNSIEIITFFENKSWHLFERHLRETSRPNEGTDSTDKSL